MILAVLLSRRTNEVYCRVASVHRSPNRDLLEPPAVVGHLLESSQRNHCSGQTSVCDKTEISKSLNSK